MVLINTADEALVCGLSLVGIGEYRQKRQRRTTNISDFKAHFGVAPIVCAQIWEDLQTSDIPEARIDTATAKGNVSIEKLLWAFHFLMRYPTETQQRR